MIMELEFADRSELKTLAEKIHGRIATLIHSFETGNALKKGITVAIIGGDLMHDLDNDLDNFLKDLLGKEE